MNICLILGLLCLVYGLIVAIAGSGGTNFYCMDWHCSDPLCAGRTASYGNVGQDTADRQVDIWNIVRYYFSVVSCD